MENRRKQPDFVPEENLWTPDNSPEIWMDEEEDDSEQTMVLRPIRDEEESDEDYEEERSRKKRLRKDHVKPDYHKYGRDPYEDIEEEPEEDLGVWPAEPEVWSGRRQVRTRQYEPRAERKKTEKAAGPGGAGRFCSGWFHWPVW